VDPDNLSLHFLLGVENPRTSGAALRVEARRAALNGLSPDPAFPVEDNAPIFVEIPAGEFRVDPLGTAVFPVRLDLRPETFFRGGSFSGEAPGDYTAALELDLSFHFDSGERRELSLGAAHTLPRIQEPRFTITSIAVRKAELINTRFKVTLRIDNPNGFPLKLGAFKYELYGEGRLWADGTMRDILDIPALGFAETDIALVMNFINMRRELLDQIIALKRVRYRFTGELTVETGIDYLPQFRMGFEGSGNSEVTE
jgi:LEA14-like dessication related protein